MLAEGAHEFFRSLQNGVLERLDVLELSLAEQFAAGVDREATGVLFAPTPDGIEALQRETQRIDARMAAGTGLVSGVLLEALADGQALGLDGRIIRLDLRHHIGRRRRRIIEDRRGHPRATLDGACAQRRCGHREHRSGGNHSTLPPTVQYSLTEILRVGVKTVAIFFASKRAPWRRVPSLQLIRTV